MNVTKFYGKVNDQEFDNVHDYNAAVTAAAAKGSFEASSRTWVEYIEDKPEDQVKKVTKFYGIVNDQDFNNVEDYNKAIIQAMSDGNLRDASSRTWVEEEVTGSTQELGVPLPQIDQEEQDCYSQLEDTFNTFGDLVEKEGITEDNINEFISSLKCFIENNEWKSKCYLADYINNEIKQLNESLDKIAISLDDEHNEVGYYKSIIDSKEKEINDQINELKNWEKEYESYKYLYEKNQNTYMLWRKLVSNLKQFQNPSQDTTDTPKKYIKPNWMSKNYFNLLQEIFK